MTEQHASPRSPQHQESRWQLLRDLLVFQVKLFLDGLRDLVMSPISLVAGLGGLLLKREHPGEWFERVLQLGRRSEAWINLFGRRSFGQRRLASLDQLVGELEGKLLEQYHKGGMTEKAKRAIDQAIDSVHANLSARDETQAGDVKSDD